MPASAAALDDVAGRLLKLPGSSTVALAAAADRALVVADLEPDPFFGSEAGDVADLLGGRAVVQQRHPIDVVVNQHLDQRPTRVAVAE
jgi:hypothetical protein